MAAVPTNPTLHASLQLTKYLKQITPKSLKTNLEVCMKVGDL